MYVCDAAVHKDAKGELKTSVKAAYKLEIYMFDGDDMIGDKADTVKDLCSGCYNMLTRGTVETAPKVAAKRGAKK